jgi:hypothetical protein
MNVGLALQSPTGLKEKNGYIKMTNYAPQYADRASTLIRQRNPTVPIEYIKAATN